MHHGNGSQRIRNVQQRPGELQQTTQISTSNLPVGYHHDKGTQNRQATDVKLARNTQKIAGEKQINNNIWLGEPYKGRLDAVADRTEQDTYPNVQDALPAG